MLKDKSLLLIASIVIPIVIFSLTAWNTYGWDDEFFTINWLELNEPFLTLINRVNSNDTQPPGMYIFDLFFFKIFGSWPGVRTSGALICALSLWLYWFYTAKQRKNNYEANLLSYILLCLNPSVLLWCTGLRWYTWLMPLVCFLGILMHGSNKISALRFWLCYYFLCIIMFHVSYCSAVIIIASFLCICYERRKFLLQELKIIITLGFMSLILVSYQIYIFLTVHYPNGSRLLGASIFRCFVFACQYFLCGAAIIPVSPSGILSIIAGLILLYAFLKNIKVIVKNCSCKFLILSYLMNIILKTGLGARYYVMFSAQQSEVMTDSFSCFRSKRAKILIILIYLAVNISGLYNVMSHKNTAKTSWDTPYHEIMNHISNIDKEKQMLIITSNPVLEWHLKQDGFNAVDVRNCALNPENQNHVIAVKTFRGSLPLKVYEDYCKYIEKSNVKSKISVGLDKYAWFKRKLNKYYPDYYAEIFVIE